MPIQKNKDEIDALVLGNNSFLEEEIKDFLKGKQIKIIKPQNNLTPIARYNIFILDSSNPSQGNLNQLIDILHQGTPFHKFILIIQKSNLNTEIKNSSSQEIFNQLGKERNLDIRTIYVWDLISTNPNTTLSSLDNLLKQSIINAAINISQDGSLIFYPLDLVDFLRGLAKVIFTSKSSNPQHTLAGSKYSDMDLFLILKENLKRKNIDLDIDQNLENFKTTQDPEEDSDKTSARLNWISQNDPEETISRLSQTMDSSGNFFSAPLRQKPYTIIQEEGNSANIIKHNQNNNFKKVEEKLSNPKYKIVDGPIRSVESKWLLKALSIFSLSVFLIMVTTFGLFYFFLSTSIVKLNLAASKTQTEDLSQTHTLLDSAQRRLNLAQVIYAPLSPAINIIYPEFNKDLDELFTFIHHSQAVLSQISTIKEIVQSVYKDSLNNQDLDLKQISASLLSSFQSLQSQLNQLNFQASLESKKTPFFKQQKNLQFFNSKTISELNSKTSSAISLSQVLPFIFPPSQPNNILVLVQDNNEYRPTGGWLNSYIYLNFSGNRLIKTQVGSSLNLAGKIEGEVSPPPILAKLTGDSNWQAHDANFYPNFPDSAKQVSWFWQKATSNTVDTIISIDLNFIKDILKINGPLTLDNGTQITSDNLDLLLLSPTIDQESDVLTQITKALVAKLEQKNLSFNAISTALINNINSSNINIYSENEKVQNIINKHPFAGLISPITCPAQFSQGPCFSSFFHFNESNFSINKSNFYQHRDVNHKIEIKEDGSFTHTIQVDYSYPTPVPNLSSSIYQSLINLYLPIEYQIESISLDSLPIDEKNIETQVNGEISQITFPLNYPLNQNHSLVIKTISEKSIDLTDHSANISLYTIKQPGTQNTTQTMEVVYPENLFPKVVSLPFTQTAHSIVFNKIDNATKTYAISFVVRK